MDQQYYYQKYWRNKKNKKAKDNYGIQRYKKLKNKINREAKVEDKNG